MSDFQPMLATAAALDALRYPLLASPKLDGIRAMSRGGVLVSRKLLPIPNHHVQRMFGHRHLEGLDGELILGDPTDDDVYRRTNSAVMSHQGESGRDVTFHVFDSFYEPTLWYSSRMVQARRAIANLAQLQVELKLTTGLALQLVWHEQTEIRTRDELDAFEAKCVAAGYEGIITRDPHAPYKFGRSTAREQIMLKVKRFEDSEAEILRVEEEMANLNEAKTDNLGRTKRSTAKDGKVGKGTMGALVVRDLKTGVEFNIGSGFTAADRQAEWLPGEIVKYKFFAVGVKDKPRHPVFLGRRSKLDL